MRPLKVLTALLSSGALAAAAPAGISLGVRDEVKTDCGTVTVYVTAPFSYGGGYSMTITRTSYDAAFVTETVGKSTATDVVEVTVSAAVSQSEIYAVITGSAVFPISSEVSSSVEGITTLRTTQTRTQTRIIYETTTHVDGDVEVNPVTVVEEPFTQVVSVPKSPPSSTWTNWHTTTVRTTTTLPGGNVVGTSYTATNDASASLSMGEKLHTRPVTTPTLVPSVEEPEETFDPEAEVVVVKITRVVEPLITLPPPAETFSTESSITNGQPVGSPHASFTAIPLSTTNKAIIAETSIASEDVSSQVMVLSSSSSVPTQKYYGPPSGWNNTYSTMTKVYASAPGYGYDHLSHDHSASSTGLATPVSGESSTQTASPIISADGPVYARSPIVTTSTVVDPVFSSLLPIRSSVDSPSHTNAARAAEDFEDGNANPYISVDWESAYWKGQTTSYLGAVSDSDGGAATTEYEYWFTSSAPVLVSIPGAVATSFGASNSMMTTASRDPPSSLRSTIAVEPTSLDAPSFAIPTVTGSVGLPPLESIAPVFTSELPESIISLWSSLLDDQTASRLSTPTKHVAGVASSSSSSASATSTSCGEQGGFSLNFDDIPPLVGNVDQPLPIFSPYKHFYFSEGFAVGPPPRIPFIPDSAPLILQFQTQSAVNVTRNDNFPLEGEYGATGEIANGPNLRYGCYSFDAVAAAVGCDSLGPDCVWQFTGVTCDPVTGDCDEPYTQFATTPGCPAGANCALTHFIFFDNFANIQGLRVNVTVEGVPKIWWMDDLQLKWSDQSCDAGNCRASHR